MLDTTWPVVGSWGVLRPDTALATMPGKDQRSQNSVGFLKMGFGLTWLVSFRFPFKYQPRGSTFWRESRLVVAVPKDSSFLGRPSHPSGAPSPRAWPRTGRGARPPSRGFARQWRQGSASDAPKRRGVRGWNCMTSASAVSTHNFSLILQNELSRCVFLVFGQCKHPPTSWPLGRKLLSICLPPKYKATANILPNPHPVTEPGLESCLESCLESSLESLGGSIANDSSESTWLKGVKHKEKQVSRVPTVLPSLVLPRSNPPMANLGLSGAAGWRENRGSPLAPAN